MEITLDALALGKPTVIKDKQYLPTLAYTEGFVKEMLKYTKRFITKVQMPSQITLSKDREDVTYNKVWIQAIMPGMFDGLFEVYGFVYALDVKTPVYKIYRAFIDPDTLNTVAFDPNSIESYSLNPNEPITVDVSNLLEKNIDIHRHIKHLHESYISDDPVEIHELLGKFIDRTLLYDYKYIGGKIKLSTNNIINAYQKTFSDLTKPINKWLLYSNICNEINDDKDITNIFEKTLLVGMLFDLVENGNNN